MPRSRETGSVALAILGAGFALDDGDERSVGLEIGAGGGADFLGGDGFDEGVLLVGIVESETVEFVEGGGGGEVTEILAGDFALAEQFGFGAGEFLVGESLAAKEFGLCAKFGFDLGGLFGGGTAIEREITREQAEEIGGTDVVGEAEFIADAHEEARTHVAAGLLNQFEGVTIRGMEGGSGKAEDDHGLFLVAGFQEATFGNRLHVGRRARSCAGGPVGKGLLDSLPRGFGIDVAVNGEDGVVGDDEAAMEVGEIRGLDAGDAGFGAELIEAISGISGQSFAKQFEGGVEQLIALALEAGELDLAFAFEGFRSPERVLEAVGDQVESEGEVAGQHLG